MALSTKHEAVALAYLTDPQHIGWRAYQSVYPNSSQHGAETQFSRLLKNVEFAARLAELGQQAAQGAVMTATEVLEGLTVLARSNMQDYVGAHGQVLDVGQLTRQHAAAIHELTSDTYMDGGGDDAREVKRVKLRLYDKRAALVDLGKHHALFTEKHVHEFGGVAERLAAALERIGDHAPNAEIRPDRDAHRGRHPRKAARKGKGSRAR